MLVRGEILFRGDAPSSSHLIRTLLTEASRAGDAFSWRLEPRSVSSGGKPGGSAAGWPPPNFPLRTDPSPNLLGLASFNLRAPDPRKTVWC